MTNTGDKPGEGNFLISGRLVPDGREGMHRNSRACRSESLGFLPRSLATSRDIGPNGRAKRASFSAGSIRGQSNLYRDDSGVRYTLSTPSAEAQIFSHWAAISCASAIVKSSAR